MFNILKISHQILFGLAACLAFIGCDGPDTIVITNESPMEIGLLVDGADANGEFIDRTILTTNTTFEFPQDIIARADGVGEVVAFNERRPPYVRGPFNWRTGKDLLTIPFQDEIELNFTVWIVDVSLLNPINNRTNETIDALAYADDVWQIQRVGLRCGDIRFVDMTNDPDANDLRDCDPCDGAYFADLRNNIGFDAGRINIYLTRRANPTNGRYFGRAGIGGDQIIMGMFTGGEDLLIHEIAHNLTLMHVDTDAVNFDSRNIATSSGGVFTTRQYFTEGQTFRMIFNGTSAVNDTYGARPGLYTTTCDHSTTVTVGCPEVQKRIWADDNNWPAN